MSKQESAVPGSNGSRLVNDWKFKPVHGDGICLHGVLKNGQEWITTPIRKLHLEKGRKFVATESGTIYELGTMHDSLWALGIHVKRPQEFEKLIAAGIL